MSDKYRAAAETALARVTDSKLRRAFGELFALAQKAVDEEGVSVVILAERRLSCVYRLLVACGMPELTGCRVLSDRLLDSDMWTARFDGHVMILDDTVILGSTLERLHRALSERTSEATTVVARSVCRSTEAADFLFAEMDFRAIHTREPSEVAALSEQLVTSLAFGLVPYLSDFPVTRKLKIGRRSLPKLLERVGWHVVDVTAPQFTDGAEFAAYSLIPDDESFSRTLGRIVPEAARLVDILKVRLFSTTSRDGAEIVLVPLALLRPASPPILAEALQAISRILDGRGDDGSTNWRDWHPIAQHRLVQMYVSAALLASIWPQMRNGATDLDMELDREVLDALHARLYFGEGVGEMLDAFERVVRVVGATTPDVYETSVPISLDLPRSSRLLEHRQVQELLFEGSELLNQLGLPDRPTVGELSKLGVGLFQSVASVFGLVDRLVEEPERQRIRCMGDQSQDDATALRLYRQEFGDEDARTLNKTLTLSELSEALLPDLTETSQWERSLISLGIDLANDVGVVVPRTRFDSVREVAYRAYRIGENAYIASRPLTDLFHEGRQPVVYDALTRCAREKNYPIQSTLRSLSALEASHGRLREMVSRLATRLAEEAIPYSEVFDAQLKTLVREAVPGRIVRRVEGVVTAVHDTEVTAEMTDCFTGEPLVGVLNYGSGSAQESLTRGTAFTWTVFDVTRSSYHLGRSSRVRVHREDPIDMDRLEIVTSYFRDLLSTQ